MATVHEQQHYDVGADELWSRIGGFHTIHTWHPGIHASEQRADDVRALDIGDGGVVVETLLAEDAHAYTYRIDESPLPVEHYEAKIAVSEDGDGSVVDWTAEFTPKGASEEDAIEVIRGIFRGGLDAL